MTRITVTNFLALLSFLSHLLILTTQQEQHPDTVHPTCFIGKGTYTNTSAYYNNRKTLLSSFTSNIKDDYGFYNYSYGQNPDTVYASGLCRGDVTPDVCRSCLKNAAWLLPQNCSNQKEAFLYNDLCIFQYSSSSMFGIYVDRDFSDLFNNSEKAADADQYTDALDRLMQVLKTNAADGGSDRKVAVGSSSTLSSGQTVHGLAQCTPDLTEQQCDDCLVNAISDIPKCCENKIGGRVIKRNCNLRFEKVRFYNSTVLHPSQGKSRNIIVIIIPIIAVAVFLLLISIFIFLKMKKPKEAIQSSFTEADQVDGEIEHNEIIIFDFDTIKLATDNFSDLNKLGQGGFGAVYKGELFNGEEVAVKRLSKGSGQGDREFRNEVKLVAKLQHRNLVRLLGFCLERGERLVVYEFLPNKSLDFLLFDPDRRAHLNWATRHKIIVGVARGLLYLHEDSRLRVIHCDLKASNILLDRELNAKISDFGLARLFSMDQTQSNISRIAGTPGYMAPEYVQDGQCSMKSDVYSFGVLILEIISGKKSIFNENSYGLVDFAWQNWRQGNGSNIIDPLLINNDSENEIMRCIHVGLLCVQENVVDRPPMASVGGMLTNHSVSLPVPSKPPFSRNNSSSYETCKDSSSDATRSSEGKRYYVQASRNEVSN